jgi:hypothetical protein
MIQIEVVWMGNNTVHTDLYTANHMRCTTFQQNGAEAAFLNFTQGRDEQSREVLSAIYMHVIKISEYRLEA